MPLCAAVCLYCLCLYLARPVRLHQTRVSPDPYPSMFACCLPTQIAWGIKYTFPVRPPITCPGADLIWLIGFARSAHAASHISVHQYTLSKATIPNHAVHAISNASRQAVNQTVGTDSLCMSVSLCSTCECVGTLIAYSTHTRGETTISSQAVHAISNANHQAVNKQLLQPVCA